jgi:hypothetical protein
MAAWRGRLGLWLAGCAALAFLTISLPAQAIVIRTAAQEGTEPKFIAGDGERIVGMCVDLFRAIEQLDPNSR